MKENAIRKINTMGKVGTIIALVTKILVSILLALSVIGFVVVLCLPSDLCTVKIDGRADVLVDLSSFGVNFDEIDQQEMVDGIKQNTDISYSGNHFNVDDVTVDGSQFSIGANADLAVFNLKDLAWALAGAIVVLIFLLISIIFAGRLTKAFRGCRSPFEETVIHRMKQFAYALIPWAVISSIVEALESRIWIASGGFSFSINISMIIVVLVILALAYIFQYGAVLQKESDETL